MIQSWNGGKRLHKESTSPPARAGLGGISCIDSTTCVAVGTGSNGNKGLVARLDSGHWSYQLLGRIRPIGIACLTSMVCLSVGEKGQYALAGEVTNHGFENEMTGGAKAVLTGISCASTYRCFAVGIAGTSHPHSVVLASR